MRYRTGSGSRGNNTGRAHPIRRVDLIVHLSYLTERNEGCDRLRTFKYPEDDMLFKVNIWNRFAELHFRPQFCPSLVRSNDHEFWLFNCAVRTLPFLLNGNGGMRLRRLGRING